MPIAAVYMSILEVSVDVFLCPFIRFVTALMNIPEEKELKYTTDMIDTNFSNYSAWHNRRYGSRNLGLNNLSVKGLGSVVLAHRAMLVHKIQLSKENIVGAVFLNGNSDFLSTVLNW